MRTPKKLWCKRYAKENTYFGESTMTSTQPKDVAIRSTSCHTSECQSCLPVQMPNTRSGKLLPCRPTPLYNIGRDLNMPNLDVTPLNFNIPHRNSCGGNFLNNDSNSVHTSTNDSLMGADKCDPLHYLQNRLSNIEVTLVPSPDPKRVNQISPSNDFESRMGNTVPIDFDSEQYKTKCPVIRVSEGLQNMTLNKVSKKSKSIVKKPLAQTRARRRKPIIREHEQDIFESVGIDESLATELIVDSNGDDFKEITKKIANNPEVADKPKVEDRIKEVRRRGKNCKAAKKSREKQIKHMQNLRETHKQLSAELSELERWHRKCQFWREKYMKYTRIQIHWRRYEEIRKNEQHHGNIY